MMSSPQVREQDPPRPPLRKGGSYGSPRSARPPPLAKGGSGGVCRGTRMCAIRALAVLAGLLGAILGSPAAGAEGREIPEPLVPLEHMIGSWKGQGIPMANRLKGWPETHMWAWKFAKGVPIGMSLAFTGNKTLAKAELTCTDGKQYRLEGTDPAGKAVVFAGTYGGTSSSKMLTLDRVGDTSEGKQRLIIWPNSNLIRYTFSLEHQDPGAPQFKKVIEVGLTKEGESFAGGIGRRPAQVHHHRRRGHDDGLVPGQDLSPLLLGLPGRIQRQPREIRQEGRPAGRARGGEDARRGRRGERGQG